MHSIIFFFSLCVCVCVYIHTHTHITFYIYIYKDIYMHTHTLVCVYISICNNQGERSFCSNLSDTVLLNPLTIKGEGGSTPVPKLSKGWVYIGFLNGHILFALMSKKYNSSVNGHLIRTRQFSSADILTLSPSLVLSPRFSSKLHTPFHLLVPSPPSWYYVLKLWILQVPRPKKREN